MTAPWRTIAVAATFAAILAGPISAASPKPDAHDRALAARLDAKVQTFKKIAAKTAGGSSLQQSLDQCAFMKKDPGQAFAALFALLPALLTQLVNDFRPQLQDIHRTVRGMDPHSALFKKWATAEGQSFALILRFDNHGKKVDLCEAATVMLDKKSTADDVHQVLGIDPALVAQLFQSPASATLTKLNPQMRTFFVAAGLSPAHAKALTS
jgi:hypothetical protein